MKNKNKKQLLLFGLPIRNDAMGKELSQHYSYTQKRRESARASKRKKYKEAV